jgi:hypothetical protein
VDVKPIQDAAWKESARIVTVRIWFGVDEAGCGDVFDRMKTTWPWLARS